MFSTRALWLIRRSVFLFLALIFLPATVYAQTDIYKTLQTPFYEPNAANCEVNLDTNLSGNDNAEKAYNYFIGKGLTPVQAAAILGNFQRESHMNPKQLQGGGESNTVPLDGKTGYGLAQWTYITRQQALDKFAKDENQPVFSLNLQLGFTWFEASSNGVMKTYKTIQNIDAATEYWMKSYENPGVLALSERISKAKYFLDKFGSSGGSVGSVTPESDGTCPGATGPGQDTKYIEGFTVYSQYDPDWVDKPYGTSTIGVSGCGPSAMAMIITALTGQQITPDITAKYATSQNLYVPGAGSSWSIAKVLAEHWGLKAQFIGASAAKINTTLQSGGLVIASGQGPLPFTSGGHYIVIRGITADGQWKIGDSGHDNTSDKAWAPQQLLASMNDGSVYAITK